MKFRMKHQLSVEIIFKILCQYWKIVSVGPFPEFLVVRRGLGKCTHPSHPLCIRACLPVLMFEVSMHLFGNKHRNKSSVEIKLKSHKVALSRESRLKLHKVAVSRTKSP